MAQVNFDDIKQSSFTPNEQTGPSVGFFSLKNDGDEALVRIMHDTTADFDILTTHPITIEGKHRRVSCVRSATDSLEKCPLCSSGAKVEQRVYIHLLQYVKDAQGNITVEPKVWERSIQYANKLRDLIAEYGPLTNNLFKIKRSGAAGSMDTTYSINYAVPSVYPAELYPNKPELIAGYKALGKAVMDKTAEEVALYLTTGSFPQKGGNTQPTGQVFTPQTETRKAPWETGVSSAAPQQAPARYY